MCDAFCDFYFLKDIYKKREENEGNCSIYTTITARGLNS